MASRTGAKCLPATKVGTCEGLVLHDCHAEVLAMRAFNHWLIAECYAFIDREERLQQPCSEKVSPYVWRRPKLTRDSPVLPPFELRPDVGIYMYCTCAPCGDASMELVMAEQDDPTPWAPQTTTTTTTTVASTSNPPGEQPVLDGRGHFSNLGIVRRKPARRDAEATRSKSCSDKLALRQVTSLLNYGASLLVAVTANSYLKGLVLPEEEISRTGIARCFGAEGRMKDLVGRTWPITKTNADTPGVQGLPVSETEGRHRYEFRPFEVLSIPNSQLRALWRFRKPKASDPAQTAAQLKMSKPGNKTVIWIRAPTLDHESEFGRPSLVTRLPTLRGSSTGVFENIIGGVRQGYKVADPGMAGASALARRPLWEHWRNAMSVTNFMIGEHEVLGTTGAVPAFIEKKYRGFKKPHGYEKAGCIKARKDAVQAAKEILGGWVPNVEDDNWPKQEWEDENPANDDGPWASPDTESAEGSIALRDSRDGPGAPKRRRLDA